MGRLSRIRHAALADLARQLRFSSREALLRQIERVEELAGAIEPAQAYPMEFVAFRVTGYRDAELPSGGVITGAELMSDLPGVIERLCGAAELKLGDPALRGGIGADELAARWKVSRKTLMRYRRHGLLARHAVGKGGRDHAIFMPGVIARVEGLRRREIARASGFTRIDDATRAKMLALAARYRAMFGGSTSRIAERLAERFGRSHEAVRLLLTKHERSLAKGGHGAGPMNNRARRVAERALRRGIEPGEIAARFGRARQSVVRAAALERLDMLRAWDASGAFDRPGSPVFARADSAEMILAPASVRSGLSVAGERTLGELIATRKRRPLPAKEERERAFACHYLVRRAAGVAATIDRHHPEPTKIDECFTLLRWATRLKAMLVRGQWPLLVSTIEGVIGVPLELAPLSAARMREVIDAGIAAMCEGVNQFDAARGGRLAAPTGMALNRAITRVVKAIGGTAARPGKAVARPSMEMDLGAWERRVDPWQGVIEADARWRGVLPTLDAEDRRVLERRNAWDGEPPATLAELARAMRTTAMRAAMMERRAIRRARAVLRGEGAGTTNVRGRTAKRGRGAGAGEGA